jgi:hypothetical protein
LVPLLKEGLNRSASPTASERSENKIQLVLRKKIIGHRQGVYKIQI